MAILPGPQPDVGSQQQVVVAGFPLAVVPGSYKRSPAKRFGDKISTGDLRYQDFNPYESAASYSSLERGYGLRRFSDLPETENPEGFYAESSNVDCRFPGICISPALTTVDVNPGVASRSDTPLWFGEWTPSTGTVTGNHWVMVTFHASSLNHSVVVYYFTAAGTVVASGNVLYAGTGAFTSDFVVLPVGGQLIIGYGSLRTAQYITSLDATTNSTAVVTDTGASQLYIFAGAVDRSSVYIAGGTATTNTNTVLSAAVTAASPATSFATSASAVTCKSNTHPITSLASGGGMAGVLVWVGKSNEIGYIDSSAVYHTAMPFQQSLSTNCKNMQWFLPGSDKSDVGQTLVFPVGRSLWAFNTLGGFTNIAPQGKQGFRPINARGLVQGIQSTTHFLYYEVKDTSGNNYIIAYDGVTGANHTYLYTANNAQQATGGVFAMGVTSLFGSNPLLYIGNSIGPAVGSFSYITLPADGDWPPADPNCTYSTALTNTLTLPDIDFGFPDEDKIPTFLRLVADNLASGAQYITVSYALDGSSTYTTLGTFFVSPQQDIPFPSTSFKRISLQLNFVTTDTTKTPIMNAISLRASINPKQYTIWSFKATVPQGTTIVGSDEVVNPNTVINALWTDYKAGTAVAYTDRWNKQWLVRILDFDEPETYDEQLRPPGTVIDMSLLELYGTGLESGWDQANTIWDNANLTWG